MNHPKPWHGFASPQMLQHIAAADLVACTRLATLTTYPLIAIVDDDAAMREALEELLQVAGFDHVAFGSAVELLEDAAPERFDLIITDLRMPQIDGIEMIRQLRSSGATLPTLVLTSCLEHEMRVKALEAGAAGYLTKPVDEKLLLQSIGAVLGLDAGGSAPGK